MPTIKCREAIVYLLQIQTEASVSVRNRTAWRGISVPIPRASYLRK